MVLSGHDLVIIRNLRVWTLVGIHPHERERRQEVCVDAWIATDTRPAAAGDDLSLTIDYSKVAEAFREHAAEATDLLIETLAENLARLVLEGFQARALRLSVRKLGAIPGVDSVGITIERTRDGVGR